MTPSAPTVACTSCERTWNSASMAEGLRLVGCCPRCGGELEFAAEAQSGVPAAMVGVQPASALAPHLVLGIPRR